MRAPDGGSGLGSRRRRRTVGSPAGELRADHDGRHQGRRRGDHRRTTATRRPARALTHRLQRTDRDVEVLEPT
ncbi:MAG: hypothetical protein QM747_03690 [Nocardioides sp.]